jgi:hypothetical protein
VSLEKILRRVARQEHFGEDHEIRLLVSNQLDRSLDLRQVTVEIAHGRVELGDGDSHSWPPARGSAAASGWTEPLALPGGLASLRHKYGRQQ